MRIPPEANLLEPGQGSASIDWDRVAAHLAGHGIEMDRQFLPRQFAGGLANVNMLVRANGGWAVLRRPPEGPIPKGAHDMAREHTVLSRLAPLLPLAPKSLHFCDDPEVAGAPFQLLEYRSGRLVRGDRIDPLPDTPDVAEAVSRMLIRTLAEVHAVDVEQAGLGDLGRPEGFLGRTAAGWIARAEAALEGRLPDAARQAADWLKATPAPESSRPVLIHNDFKLDNLLLHPERIEPVALLDWDMATRGDPLYDLACLLSYWTEQGDPQCLQVLRQMPSARPGFLSRMEAAALYAEISGCSLVHFRFHRVLAMFRLAVVFHQLRSLAARNPRLEAGIAGIDPDAFFGVSLDIANARMD